MKHGTKFSHLFTGLLPILLGVLTVAGLLLGAQPASAAPNTCIQNVWQAHGNKQSLTCTANDVTLSSATNINILSGGQCVIEDGVRVCRCNSGGQVTFTADFRMDLTSQTRFDVGFYVAEARKAVAVGPPRALRLAALHRLRFLTLSAAVRAANAAAESHG